MFFFVFFFFDQITYQNCFAKNIGYLSSSVLESTMETKPKKRNTSIDMAGTAQTDGGLMTVVMISDDPTLSLFDQKEQNWIPIELLAYRYFKEKG